MPRPYLRLLCLCLMTSPAWGNTVALAPEIVSATRMPDDTVTTTVTAKFLAGTLLERAPTATLDAALRSAPAFGLFRRSDSLTAHPTAQGVSLRGLGPSGASRSLVLFDNVPLNDPFGGWVAWSKLPREGLEGAEVVPGAGASAWGNAALGGVVHVRTPDVFPTRYGLAAMAGDFGTHSVELTHRVRVDGDTVVIRGRLFGTDGFSLMAPERRGPIDVAAWSRHRWLSAQWTHFPANRMRLTATVRGYEEKRGNGTPYQQNKTREQFASLALAGSNRADLQWSFNAYAQDQTFASTFSAVNATRTAETPASDQFDVPAAAFGAAWAAVLNHGNARRTSFGVDARHVDGETRENATFSAALNAFTRQRIAGGEQTVGGVFVVHQRPLATKLTATIGGRIDTWSDTDGHRRETDLTNGAQLRNDRYADRDGDAFSPTMGLLWQPQGEWRIRASAQHAFRRPTLNELYRPFRVGPNITEANAALRTEEATSGEIGVEWRSAGVSPASGQMQARTPALPQTSLLTLSATAFYNDLRDAVGNVTLVRGPGNFPLFGFVPNGGVGRQRQNLERIRVQGFELSAHWRPTPVMTFTADYLYNDATVTRSLGAPGLVGKRLAQVPRHTAALGASIEAPGKLAFTPRLRWIGRQFEDDENQLILGEVVIADITVTHTFSESAEIFVTVENLGNARIETGRTADGLVNVGTPRFAFGGMRVRW